MKKHYPWLCFDADGTLFDYDYAEAQALKNTFLAINLPFEDGYLDVYRGINQGLWQALERHEITPAVLPLRRFELLLDSLQVRGPAQRMSSVYLEQLALCAESVEGAYEVLQALHSKSRIAIVTNGLQSVQRGRLGRSSVRDFIDKLVISEEVGAAKPQAAFFDAVFARLGNPLKSDVLIIGDSLSSDIQGGLDYGLDTCWYNPTHQPLPAHLGRITFEIKHLRELLDLLE
jgi:YjjG family noncanonical pyrimidine nucleotidase